VENEVSTADAGREVHRRDADGNLTVWGARDVLLDLLSEVSMGPVQRDKTTRLLECALDDLEDAVRRTHDAFGCVETRDADGEVRERYVCPPCAASELTRERTSGECVTVIPPKLYDELVRDDDIDDAGYEAYARAPDAEDRAVAAARRERRIVRSGDPAADDAHWVELKRLIGLERAPLTDDERAAVDVIKRRIFSGLPVERDPSRDAVRDVRADRDTNARDDESRWATTSPPITEAAIGAVRLEKPVIVRAGESVVLRFTLDDGTVVPMTLRWAHPLDTSRPPGGWGAQAEEPCAGAEAGAGADDEWYDEWYDEENS